MNSTSKMSSKSMLPLQILPENLELIARQVVEGFIIGLHKSPFHGFSVEFAEHRLYNPGDSLKHIDWRVLGRTDKLFVKKYEEETNLRCCLALDLSASMNFRKDEQSPSKREYAFFMSAAILQMLKRQLDASSPVFFDEHIQWFSDCRSTLSHYHYLTQELSRKLRPHAEESKGTGIYQSLHEIAERMHRRSLIVILSDMIDDAADSGALFSALQHLRYNKHEVILFHITEGFLEVDFNFENRPYEFVDMETGERVRLQPQQIKEDYTKKMRDFRQIVENQCHQYSIDYIPIDLSVPVEQALYAFLWKRNKML